MIRFKTILEARIIDVSNPFWYKTEPPLRDNEVLRVYHGFYDLGDAFRFATKGMSGLERTDRRYSYENVNNPKGLFVTTMLKVAKNFSGGTNVIMEFVARVSDLEAPVWKGGLDQGFEYGENGENFEKEREQKRLANREDARKVQLSPIQQSDRPELAQSLFGWENQALFVGDLNPNMIRAFWERDPEFFGDMNYHHLSRRAFLKKHHNPDSGIGRKLLQPADDYDRNKAILACQKFRLTIGKPEEYDEWIESAQKGEYWAVSTAQNLFWPKQLKQLGIPLRREVGP